MSYCIHEQVDVECTVMERAEDQVQHACEFLKKEMSVPLLGVMATEKAVPMLRRPLVALDLLSIDKTDSRPMMVAARRLPMSTSACSAVARRGSDDGSTRHGSQLVSTSAQGTFSYGKEGS
mmetsp:Transcript_57961/g.136610  ORF Transcript_57961/g.136610 Transcript_57961/m.136610 type:complete len:121 (-) Transcript_57961:78-440(-)